MTRFIKRLSAAPPRRGWSRGEEPPQAISMRGRPNISGLCITRSWAQDITQEDLQVSEPQLQFSGRGPACRWELSRTDTTQTPIRTAHVLSWPFDLFHYMSCSLAPVDI